MVIRPAHISDLPYLYEICHRTGHEGHDASDVVSDRFLLGHYFAAPYLVKDASWCWVAADAEGPAGYLVATPDSRSFAAWMDREWLPSIQGLFPKILDPGWSSFEAWLRGLVHEPASFPTFVDAYPAHLHIDLLPRAQGQGLGRRLVSAFLDRSLKHRLKGFHLGVSRGNLDAQAFYHKLGLQVIQEETGVIYLGLALGAT